MIGDEIVDLGNMPGVPQSVAEILASGPEVGDRIRGLIERGTDRLALDSVELLNPVRPGKFFAIGLNYADHVAETGRPTPEHLVVFSKAITSVTGPFADVERPVASAKLDYEGELGFVIGRRCRHVKAQDAPNVIGGYLIVNDFSARDWQRLTPQWSLAKSFDTHGPMGPWVVTPDDLEDPHHLDLRTYVNGELRQCSNTSNLIFNCFQQVEILSEACTLEPGDVVATGTPSGVAAAMDGQPFLVPGDVVRVEIDGIGAIENRIVAEQPPLSGDNGHAAEDLPAAHADPASA